MQVDLLLTAHRAVPISRASVCMMSGECARVTVTSSTIPVYMAPPVAGSLTPRLDANRRALGTDRTMCDESSQSTSGVRRASHHHLNSAKGGGHSVKSKSVYDSATCEFVWFVRNDAIN
jgi:hypothetical protein